MHVLPRVLVNSEEAGGPERIGSAFRSRVRFLEGVTSLSDLRGVCSRVVSGLICNAVRYGLAVALLALAIIFATRSFAQTVALTANQPAEATMMSSRAASDRSLTLHVSFRLRNPKAVARLLADLQDPASPQYHQWLTPEQFNSRFGRTPAEVQAVAQWLSEHGLRVMRSSNREMTYAATVAQAEETFATTIAASADGATFANAAAPRIPARFADVIGSIEGLDNLRHWMPITARPPELKASANKSAAKASLKHHSASAARFDPADSRAAVGPFNFGPQDLWTFYNETPPIDGANDGSGGDCVGIVEDSDYLDASVTTFDTNFSLPVANVTRVFAESSSPGTNIDETEALVDIEYAHSTAPGVPIKVYIGNSGTQDVDPLTDSILKAISDNACGAISFSYVFCGSPPSFYSGILGSALTQAAAQGQSFFAASGDWGTAGLDLLGTKVCDRDYRERK